MSGADAAGRPLRVVVVGSGVAGLVTALALGPEVEVTVVTKGAVSDGNTRYAQGGIAAAVMPGDTLAAHIADTLAAGAGLCDPRAVEVLCTEGPDRIRDLIRWGVQFDLREPGAEVPPLAGGGFPDFDAGLEAAHSFHRILHAGGDATGFEVESALVRAVAAAGIRVVEHAFLVDLVTEPTTASGLTAGGEPPRRVVGVELLREGRREVRAADVVVLATGGLGQLFPHTTNPSVTTGDGAAAALRAGAVLTDVEFVQFHPTALAVEGSFLVSEAVRGDGAVLRNARGERFMVGRHPLAELAPRDVVAREIAREMLETGQPVVLDATAIGADELRRRFPTITAAALAAGFDWTREPVPVAPAAHYWMGGIATDLDGRTSLPGLVAVGEVACTGVHGANRLASNSLLESVVFAHRAAAAIRASAVRADAPSPAAREADAPIPAAREADAPGQAARVVHAPAPAAPVVDARRPPARDVDPWQVGEPAVGPAALPDFDAPAFRRVPVSGGPAAPASTTEVPAVAVPAVAAPGVEGPTRAELHELLWRAAGVHRDGPGLREAAARLATWRIPTITSIPVGTATPAPGPAVIERLENANLLVLARAVVASALEREESRGAHFRADFPVVDPAFAHHLVPVPVETAAAPAPAVVLGAVPAPSIGRGGTTVLAPSTARGVTTLPSHPEPPAQAGAAAEHPERHQHPHHPRAKVSA